MSEADPVFLVNPYNDPVVIKVRGRAGFANSAPLEEFLRKMIEQGKRSFIIDFQRCTGMDSTFLGILAGIGLKVMRADPPGRVVLCRLGSRNHELVCNLGLHRIMVVDDGTEPADEDEGAGEALPEGAKRSEIESARMVLQAHENLVDVDESNRAKFQDVIGFLRNQVDSD